MRVESHSMVNMQGIKGGFIVIGALATLIAWAFVSPVGSSPDDNFHLSSIWCGNGPMDGQCELVNDSVVKVPTCMTHETFCYIFDQNKSAACQYQMRTDWDESPLSIAPWTNHSAKIYPKGYYFVMSFFVHRAKVLRSILTIRVVNACLALFLWVSLFFLAQGTAIRAAFILPLLILSIPLGVFIIASNNPSAWAVISQSTFWAFLALLIIEERKVPKKEGSTRLPILWTGTLLSAIIGISSRADGTPYVFLIMALVVWLFVRSFKDLFHMLRSGIWLSSAFILISITGLYFFLFQGQGTEVISNGLTSKVDNNLTFQELLGENVFRIPELWYGAFGNARLGWLDTPMPMLVGVIVFSIFTYTLFVGLHEPWIGKWLAVVVLLSALYFIPLFVLMKGGHIVGQQVQPRYLLPLFYPLLGFALLNRNNEVKRYIPMPIFLVIAALLSIAHAGSLYTNIRRYVTGLDVNNLNLNIAKEWWWDFGPEPLTVWIIGSVGFAICAILLSLTIQETTSKEPSL